MILADGRLYVFQTINLKYMSKRREHLLVIRSSAMGDVAMTVPVLKALRKSYPELKITILTRSFFQPFFRELSFDRVVGDDGKVSYEESPLFNFIELDNKGRHKGLAGLIRLYRDISSFGVTHVADLHNVLRTMLLRPLLRSNGCKIAVLNKGRAEKRAMTRKHQKVMRPLKPTVERYRDVLLALGFEFGEPLPVERQIAPIPEAITKVAGEKSGVWIGVAPFAQHQGKIYPTDQADELISLLAERYERVFVFGGGPYEQEFAEAMEERHEGVFSVIGRIKLNDELDFMPNIDVMVTMDSASMHMASLVGTPVVSIWGATHPAAGFYGFGQDPANAVQVDLPCRPCSVYGNKPCMFRDYRCMTGVTPQMVVERIAKVVGRETVAVETKIETESKKSLSKAQSEDESGEQTYEAKLESETKGDVEQQKLF